VKPVWQYVMQADAEAVPPLYQRVNLRRSGDDLLSRYATGGMSSGKEQANDDLEPGELPDCESLLVPASDREGILS